MKQTFLPGMTPPSHPKLDVKADDYYGLVRQRQGLQEQENISKAEIIALLKELKLESYETPEGIIVELKEEEKLKTRKKKEPTALVDVLDGGLGESDEFNA